MGFMDRINKKGIYSDSITERIQSIQSEDLNLEELIDIARNDDAWQVRSAAYMRIGSEDYGYLEIAYNDGNSDNAISAVRNIKNVELLDEFSLKAKNAKARKVAVARIRNLRVLKEVALNDTDPTIRNIALSRVNDENYIKNLP